MNGHEHRGSLVGNVYNKLTVIKQIEPKKTGARSARHWLCKCTCGNEHIATTSALNGKQTKSCGCSNFSKNGWGHTRFLNIFKKMHSRCSPEKINSYTARGIKVCEEWYDFEKFKSDMYGEYLKHSQIHGERNTTIDRIDSSKGYEKDNCRWATYSVQQNNRSNNVRIEVNGVFSGTMSEVAKYFDVSYQALGLRIRKGETPEKAISDLINKKALK